MVSNTINKSSSISRKIVFGAGKFSACISALLFAAVFLSYLFRTDALAALTFFPPWTWGFMGLGLSLFAALFDKRIMICLVLSWIIFIAIFAEEPKSLIRGCFFSFDNWHNIPVDKRLVVVSLNCAGGNIQAAREVIDYNPDIVFLQESPVKEEVERFAYTLFMEHAVIAYGPDTSIIARGKLQQTALPEPVNIFMTLACIQLKSGHDIQIASIRLQPPVIEENLFSAGCWQRHYKDRKSRRKQLARAFEQLDYVHKGQPVILGGDFNVSANDGCLGALNPYLSDTFNQGGIGWGHTAINEIPLFRVDQIWASSHFNVFASFSRKTIHSDHRMVISFLEFSE